MGIADEFEELEDKLKDLTSMVDFLKMKLNKYHDTDIDMEYNNYLCNKNLMKQFHNFVEKTEPLFFIKIGPYSNIIKGEREGEKTKLEFAKDTYERKIKSFNKSESEYIYDPDFTEEYNTLLFKGVTDNLYITCPYGYTYLVRINDDDYYLIGK